MPRVHLPPGTPVMKSLLRVVEEIHRRSVWQVAVIFLAAAWAALQVAESAAAAYDLPGWFIPFAVVLLLIGFPIVIGTAIVQKGFRGIRSVGPPPEDPPERRAPTAEGPPWIGAFNWKFALGGGGLAFLLWVVVAAAWILLGPGGR